MSDEKPLNWKSCCRGRKCAEVALDGGYLRLRDDFGGSIRIGADSVWNIEETNGALILTDTEGGSVRLTEDEYSGFLDVLQNYASVVRD